MNLRHLSLPCRTLWWTGIMCPPVALLFKAWFSNASYNHKRILPPEDALYPLGLILCVLAVLIAIRPLGPKLAWAGAAFLFYLVWSFFLTAVAQTYFAFLRSTLSS